MSDDVIWHCIRHNHCSFMAKITTGIFCRNPYNATGICNRSSCPLANSRYATIRDHDGIFYLYMKTAERAHHPNKLWERVKLPRNYEKAIEVINRHLEFWPKLLVHKIKQRLTKMTQYRIRMRKLRLKVSYPFKVLDMEKGDVDPEEDEEEEVEEYVEGDYMDDMEDMEDFEGLPGGDYGEMNEDDLSDERIAKKPKVLGSDLRSNIGKKSKKPTEVELDEDIIYGYQAKDVNMKGVDQVVVNRFLVWMAYLPTDVAVFVLGQLAL
uniref:Protein MAK16 homolog n=1 Tax=Oryza sativa subsp. japonica TaxID=39947 RepID=Q6Z4K4_ORYSJ|nr:putative RNA binding protein [Oryza sativa Japonica Group]